MDEKTAAIEALAARRDHLRALLSSHRFDELDTFLVRHESAWLDGPTLLFAYRWYLAAIIDPMLPRPALLAHLQAWRTERPASYHAHLLSGAAWIDAAGAIRGADSADNVSPGQWAGANLARDHAVIHHLRAIDLNPRPAYAYRQMMNLSGFLDEPAWLLDLAADRPASSYEAMRARFGDEAWAQGLQQLQDYGSALPDIPAALPARLPARQPHEFEDGITYWLQLARQARQQDLGAREIFLYFLYPRWNGDHKQMQAFIDGPLCQALSERDRNELRVKKEFDILETDGGRRWPSPWRWRRTMRKPLCARRDAGTA